MLESGFPSKTFSGVRFALVGFNPVDENTLRSKLMSGGGVDVGQYSQTSTHLIVDKLVYDDPVCVAARNSGKVVVTGSWVDHSFDLGMLIDAHSVLYRPLRDLNGIPGSKSLVVCLTGYQRQDREDIMTMVDLMGGQFSKPLVANRVTHLICYKFEGEKYELAKRMKRIKLVNHRWLEDCLKNWKLLPEVEYEISGYELEMMEASARDSEDEAEDASVKRANTSPLGLRVGAVAAVEMSKSVGKHIPVVQTNSGAQDGSSLGNTSKEKWLTPKKLDKPLEAMVSTDLVAAQQHNYQRASTFQNTSTYASPVPVNKTSERGMGRVETGGSTSINMSTRRHSSLATYSRKTLQRSPDTSTLGNESSGRTLRIDDRGLKGSAAFNISASKSGSSLERTLLFEDLDKIDKLHGEEPPPLLPQAKLSDGYVSSKGSQKVHHSSEASIPPPASLLLQELRTGSPKENLRPVPSINDPTEREEVCHKSPASDLNVVPMGYAMSTAENIISKCAPDEIAERSSPEPMVGNILLQEPRSGSSKQNLMVVPNISDHAEEIITFKDALDEVPERSVTEPVMMRSSTSPGSGLIGMKDQVETELPKKKTAPRKSLGTGNQKGSIYLSEPTPKDEQTDCLIKGKALAPATDNGNLKEISSPVLDAEAVPEMAKRIDSEDNKSYAPGEKDHLVTQDKLKDQVETELPKKKTAPRKSLGTGNQKGSIYLSEPTPKDEQTDCLIKGKALAPATDNGNLKEISSPVLDAEAVPEMAKRIDSEDNKSYAPGEKDHLVTQDKLQAKTTGEVDAEVEITMLESELTDVPTKDPSDGASKLEVSKSKSKRTREATVGKNSLQSGKKKSSSAAEVGISGVKKTKKSRKQDDAKANDTVMKDIRYNSANEMENVALENKSGKVSSGGDQSLGETLVRTEAETKDPDDAAVQLGVDKKNDKRIKEDTVERNKLQSGKKRSSSTIEFEKASVKKAKKSKKEDDAKANDTVMNDAVINSLEMKENVAVSEKPEDVSSDGAQSPVARKPLARKETAAKSPSNAAMQLGKRKNRKDATVERSSLQIEKKGKSSVKKPKKSRKEGGDTVMKVIGDDNSAEEENIAVDNKSGRDKSPVLARKEAAKTGSKADKKSKRLSRKVLQEQKKEPKFFIVSGPRSQRKEYQKIIKLLEGKCCRDSHQWSYQATHFIAPEIRRTEKFFAAAASGSWILKTDYVADSKEAGKLLPEEPYEWHSTGLSADGAISLESPRKWRLVKEQTGHGALYGMRVVVYGDCFIPSLDTLKRAVKSGDGTILATAPPYTRFLNQNTDFALISPGMPHDDVWIQEFIRNEIPCVLSDYIVEYVCKPGYALDKHVLYNTNTWAERSFHKLQFSAEN